MGAVPFVLKMTSFVEKLSPEALAHFNEVTQKPFSQQAVAFLNAYWPEVHDQAEFIFTVAWEVIKYADMHAKGIQLIFQYEEGNDLDFDIGLYFYEQLCKFVEQPKNAQWAGAKFARSQPTMMTAIKRKQEIREARLALEEVSKRIRAYEAEKARLTKLAAEPGVKGLKAKNELAQLDSSPLWEQLNAALITAEAAVRIATKKFGGGNYTGGAEGGAARPTDGAIWWMNRDLEEKKKRYGR